MGFKEWFNEDDHDLYNYPEEAMQEAWNASIDEAAKIAILEANINITMEPSPYNKACKNIADKIKELKG